MFRGQDVLQRNQKRLRDLILDAEGVVHITIIEFRPQTMPGDGIPDCAQPASIFFECGGGSPHRGRPRPR